MVSFFSLTMLTSRSLLAGVLADDHALVDLVAGRDEELAARLQVLDRVGGRLARAVGDQRAGRRGAAMSPCQGSQPSKRWFMMPVPRVSVRNSVRKPISPRDGMRNSMPHAAGAVVDHLHHPAAPRADLLGDDADVLLGAVDDQLLHRLVELAVDRRG